MVPSHLLPFDVRRRALLCVLCLSTQEGGGFRHLLTNFSLFTETLGNKQRHVHRAVVRANGSLTPYDPFRICPGLPEPKR